MVKQKQSRTSKSKKTTPAKEAYAGFWLRFCAWVIDALVLAAASVFIGLLFVYPTSFDTGTFNVLDVFGIIIAWLYYALFESSEHQATLGKMALGLRVVDMNKKRLTFARATGRHFAKIISVITIGIGFVMIGLTKKKQGLHDMVASCLVTRK